MGENFWATALAVYKMFGREHLKRFLTPPRSAIERICARTGADVEKAVEERNEMVEEVIEFVESLVDKDFVDPD